MRAVTVEPGRQSSLAVADVPDPSPAEGELLVDGVAVGVCGTDKEIVDGEYGWAPDESAGFAVGDLVVGVVRRVGLAKATDAFDPDEEDVKVVIDLDGGC